jgi:hypothetical protein
MPLFGKTGEKARNFLAGDVGQALMRTASGLIPGDPYGYMLARQARDEKMAMQGKAIADLMSQFQPDTMTPQVNELIGQANYDGRGRFDALPMQQQQPGRFQFESPEGRAALAKALGAGVSLDGITSLRDFMSPKRNTTKLGPDDILFDDEGNLIAQGPRTPPKPENPLVVPQGGSVFWPGQQTPGYVAPKTFAPKAPRGGAPVAGPSIDQPWTMFKQ